MKIWMVAMCDHCHVIGLSKNIKRGFFLWGNCKNEDLCKKCTEAKHRKIVHSLKQIYPDTWFPK
ncbi:MAG: hypothetical protein [Bacteriophage sp.]|nr:MAG: hypothetical protein [Bacteriophage sp.]